MPYIKKANPIRFAQTATVTVASTAAETTLVGAGEGSLTLNAGSTLIGKTFKIKGAGIFSNTGTPTLDIKVKLGAVTLLDTGAITTVTTASGRLFLFEGIVTVRTVGASGTAFAQGLFVETLATGVSLNYPMVNASTSAIDTTAELAFNVTAQWGASSASNTISLTNLILEEVN
jgi:hypothetical protein